MAGIGTGANAFAAPLADFEDVLRLPVLGLWRFGVVVYGQVYFVFAAEFIEFFEYFGGRLGDQSFYAHFLGEVKYFAEIGGVAVDGSIVVYHSNSTVF